MSAGAEDASPASPPGWSLVLKGPSILKRAQTRPDDPKERPETPSRRVGRAAAGAEDLRPTANEGSFPTDSRRAWGQGAEKVTGQIPRHVVSP